MKSYVAIALFGLLAVAAAHPFTEDQMQKADEHLKHCMAQEQIDPEVVKNLRAGDYSNVDAKVKCFILCFFQKSGFMDAQANQIENVIIEKLSVDNDPTKVKALFEKCKNEKGATPCDTAFAVYQCYRSSGAL